MDLYEILGVHKDASPKTIREAYREKARVLHPDVEGGNAEAFNQARLARDVLLKAEWRKSYDESGIIPEEQADNEQAFLITALTGMFGQVMQELVRAKGRPENGDFIAALQATIAEGTRQTLGNISQVESSILLLEGMQGRFKLKVLDNPNHLETIVGSQTAGLKRQLEGMRASVRQLEMARVYLNDVSFKQGQK